jgi:hypothetical protein
MFKYRILEETVAYPPFQPDGLNRYQTFYTIQRSTDSIRWEAVWDTHHQDQAVSRVKSWQKEQGESSWETVDIQEQVDTI